MHASGLEALAFRHRSYCSICGLQRSLTALTGELRAHATLQARGRAGCRQGGCSAYCFAAQALSDCFSSLHVACQLPGLASTQSTYALSSVGQCRSTVANAASIRGARASRSSVVLARGDKRGSVTSYVFYSHTI